MSLPRLGAYACEENIGVSGPGWFSVGWSICFSYTYLANGNSIYYRRIRCTVPVVKKKVTVPSVSKSASVVSVRQGPACQPSLLICILYHLDVYGRQKYCSCAYGIAPIE